MEYRNSGNATHYSKGLVTDVDAAIGVEHSGSTVVSAADAANANLTVRAKGTGTLNLGDSSNVVNIGGSTMQFRIVSGISSYTAPALSSFATGESTITLAGLSTGDLIIGFDFRGQPGGSTKLAFSAVWPTPSASSEATIQFINPHNSTASGSSGRVRWAYIDRT